ncbi:MAG TPA: LLM class flavin-dependent oxidoreductase [Acidimicrobiales bacterium]|nr:LLM class flavin-dependent oxidoreductase [Acidimicrobiales bacterium]
MVSTRTWLGVHLKSDGAITALSAIALANEAEQLGFSGVTLNEDVGDDVFGALGAMSVATDEIALGSAIVPCCVNDDREVALTDAGTAFVGRPEERSEKGDRASSERTPGGVEEDLRADQGRPDR